MRRKPFKRRNAPPGCVSCKAGGRNPKVRGGATLAALPDHGRRGRGPGDVAPRQAVSRQRQGRRAPAPVAAA